MPSDQLDEDPMLIAKKKIKMQSKTHCVIAERKKAVMVFFFLFFLMLSFKKLASGCVGVFKALDKCVALTS